MTIPPGTRASAPPATAHTAVSNGGEASLRLSCTRAAKLGRRAARVGFEWPDIEGARNKVDEELAELDEAVRSGDRDAIESEMGDMFFALVNVCRHLEIDPEACARVANRRFQARFEQLEQAVEASGRDWRSFELAELEEFWLEAKKTLSTRV